MAATLQATLATALEKAGEEGVRMEGDVLQPWSLRCVCISVVLFCVYKIQEVSFAYMIGLFCVCNRSLLHEEGVRMDGIAPLSGLSPGVSGVPVCQ